MNEDDPLSPIGDQNTIQTEAQQMLQQPAAPPSQLQQTLQNPSMDDLGNLQDMLIKGRHAKAKTLLTDTLSNFLFSLGQGMQASAQYPGPRGSAAGFGAALQGPQLLAQMRQQQQAAQQQRQAQMMQAQAALQNQQSLAKYRDAEIQNLAPVPVKVNPDTGLLEETVPAEAQFYSSRGKVGQAFTSVFSATKHAETAAATQAAMSARQGQQFDFKKGMESILQENRSSLLEKSLDAKANQAELNRQFEEKQKGLDRENKLVIARIQANAKDGKASSPTDIGYIADQVQRDAGLLVPLTSGNQLAKSQVIAELGRRGTTLTALTNQTKNMAQNAKDLLGPISNLQQQLDNPKLQAKLGPAIGRWNDFQAGKIGAGDADFQYLNAFSKLISSGVLRAHFGARGGQQMYQHFEDQLNAGKMDAPTMKATLQAWSDFLSSAYVEPVYGAPQGTPTQPAAPAPTAGVNPFRKPKK